MSFPKFREAERQISEAQASDYNLAKRMILKGSSISRPLNVEDLRRRRSTKPYENIWISRPWGMQVTLMQWWLSRPLMPWIQITMIAFPEPNFWVGRWATVLEVEIHWWIFSPLLTRMEMVRFHVANSSLQPTDRKRCWVWTLNSAWLTLMPMAFSPRRSSSSLLGSSIHWNGKRVRSAGRSEKVGNEYGQDIRIY